MSDGRWRSLDVFRGATVALMILVNNPGTWSALYPPLAHAPWHGLTPTDLVFPFFLFAVGNALACVMPALQAAGPAHFWRRVGQRTLLIFAIGLLLNASPFVRWDGTGELVWRSWESLRLMGVLQRIALCFGAAAVVVWLCGRRSTTPVLGVVAALLLGYWGACLALGAPGDPYSLAGWFGTALDRAVLGTSHLYRGEGVPFDPEGLASTPPAVAQVLLGWWVGRWVQGHRAAPGSAATPSEAAATATEVHAALVVRLFLWATALAVLAYLWQLAFPLNKKIWTSSYVLMTTAGAMALLAVCVHRLERPAAAGAGAQPGAARAIDRLEAFGWRFCEAFGRNPLFIFVLSGLVPRVLSLLRWQTGSGPDGTPSWTTPLPWAYQTLFAPWGRALGDERLSSLAFALAQLALYGALALWMDRRRWYVRV